MNRLVALAATVLFAIAPAAPATGQTPRQTAPGVRLRGILDTRDLQECGAPAKLVWAHRVPASDSLQMTIEVGEEGVVLSPTAPVDASGQFLIQVPSSFLPADGRIFFSISCSPGPFRSLHLPLQIKATRAAIIVIRPGVRGIFLDTLTAIRRRTAR